MNLAQRSALAAIQVGLILLLIAFILLVSDTNKLGVFAIFSSLFESRITIENKSKIRLKDNFTQPCSKPV